MENTFIVYKFDKKRAFGFVAAMLLPILSGILSSILTDYSSYTKLEQPPLAPSPVVFILIWSALYVLMGAASYLIWRDTEKFTPKKPDASLTYYFILLIAAFLWPVLFFNLELRLLSAVWAAIVSGLAVLVTLKFFKINKLAAYLMIPLAAWLLFSLYLNIAFAVMN